ncbi:MAG: DnaA N-terminal domain-containing protein [Afipia sp.]
MAVVDLNDVRRERERGTSFTARKFAAVQRAMRDTAISHLDFRVYYYLVDAVDAETGLAKRKQRVIAADLCLGRRTVQESLVRLREHGVIEFEIPVGKSYTNSYRVVVEKARDAAPSSDGKARPGAPFENERRGAGTKKARDRDKKGAGTRAHDLPFNSLDIPSRERGPSSTDVLGPAAALERRLGSDKFASWFSGVSIVEEMDDTVTLKAPTKFKANYLMQHFESDILAAWQMSNPKVIHIRIQHG